MVLIVYDGLSFMVLIFKMGLDLLIFKMGLDLLIFKMILILMMLRWFNVGLLGDNWLKGNGMCFYFNCSK